MCTIENRRDLCKGMLEASSVVMVPAKKSCGREERGTMNAGEHRKKWTCRTPMALGAGATASARGRAGGHSGPQASPAPGAVGRGGHVARRLRERSRRGQAHSGPWDGFGGLRTRAETAGNARVLPLPSTQGVRRAQTSCRTKTYGNAFVQHRRTARRVGDTSTRSSSGRWARHANPSATNSDNGTRL
jgi:hypothetical protein